MIKQASGCADTYRVLILLDLLDGTVVELESDDIGVVRDILDDGGRLEGRPPLREGLELDEVPDVTEGLRKGESRKAGSMRRQRRGKVSWVS